MSTGWADVTWPDAPWWDAAGLVDSMVTAASSAARIIRVGARDRDALVWETKGAADYVTQVDRAAEHAIRDLLEHDSNTGARVPVLGEESWSGGALPAGWCFVVDPLDGTTNFLHGFPPYAVSVAALQDGVPMAGVVLDVVHEDVYAAVRGGGAYRNERDALHVSAITDPARAIVGTGIPFGGNAPLERYAPEMVAVARATAGIRRAGSAAMDLAWVAAGVLDAFWELHLSPWDVAAGLLLVHEAGGFATTLAGAPAPVARGGVVAGNPSMHAWLLDTLRTADRERVTPGTAGA